MLFARKVNETARKVGQKMGLPAGWDVVERMAGTDAARLLKKEGRRCRVTNLKDSGSMTNNKVAFM